MHHDEKFEGLIFDLGVSEGNDTDYYLAKGFRVVAVEADPDTCKSLRNRFKDEIASGRLLLLNFAASDTFGDIIDFYVHDFHQGVSAVVKRAELPSGYSECRVMTIDWKTLRAQAGVPRYLKIDIEGQEELFMLGLLASGDAPEFISVECYKFRPIELLFELGYRRFKLIDQNPPGGFKLPSRQLEGRPISEAKFEHASGPFGLDVFVGTDWMDFEELKTTWNAVQPQVQNTWFDCHAWKPN